MRRVVGMMMSLASALVFAQADAAPPERVAPQRSASSACGTAVTETGLPINRRFASLDAYLACLQERSHLDGAWYREVRPGLYELQTGNLRLTDGDRPRRTFTREDLEKKFGFSR